MNGDGILAFTAEVQRLLYRLVRSYELCDQQCLGQYKVTASQAYTLLALPQNSDMSMNELSQAMGLANSTMTRMVDHLVEKGLTHRRADDEDRRVVRVGLTVQGQDLRNTLESAQQGFLQEILAEIREDERPTIILALDKLNTLIGKALRGACCGK